MKKLFFVFCLGLFATTPAHALSKQEKVAQILDALNSQETTKAWLDNAFLNVSCSFVIPQEDEQKTRKEFEKAMGLSPFIDSLTQFWVDNYTDQELDAILSFYQTEAGRKVASLQPKYAIYVQQVMQNWAKEAMPAVMKLGDDYSKKYRHRSGSEAEACIRSKSADK